MKYDVFFYEAFKEEEEALRRYLPGGLRAGFTWRAIQEAGDREPPAAVISVRTQSVLPVEWAGKLRGIVTRSTGYEHVVEYLRETGAGIACGYLPLYCNRAVAEQALLMWLALLRKLRQQMAQLPRFERDGITGAECAGARLAVFGVGNIGYEVVRIGRGLDMEVVGVDIVKRHRDVRYVSREEGLRWAEVIVCAMNLTKENEGYFAHGVLREARRGVIFVNVARGEFSPPVELLELLDEGQLGGVGLDVYPNEKQMAAAMRCGAGEGELDEQARAVLELARRPNAIVTPHNAFNTREAVERKARQAIEQVEEFRARGRFKGPVPLGVGGTGGAVGDGGED
ncbi:MAG: hydroxyacid dehydrogenase [bacterium]|nr:hydroxyacid dehydrogenase [bacterium]